LIILTGCAKRNSIKTESQEDVLRKRITEFWNHRVNLELDKCYYYEYPLLRKKISLVQYIKSFNIDVVKWKKYSIKSIRIFDKENAEVKLDLVVSVKMPSIARFDDATSVTEKWVTVDGIWYHVAKRFL
jgi:hypothetical protein